MNLAISGAIPMRASLRDKSGAFDSERYRTHQTPADSKGYGSELLIASKLSYQEAIRFSGTTAPLRQSSNRKTGASTLFNGTRRAEAQYALTTLLMHGRSPGRAWPVRHHRHLTKLKGTIPV